MWDVICIGSGTGSLAAATTLAKSGRSVLVLESHSQIGGLTHTFARREGRWSTGFHYTGWPTCYQNDFPELWRILTSDRAPWQRLPENNDVYIRPDGVFTKRSSRELYRSDLYDAFPEEKSAIDRYLADMQSILHEYLRFMRLQSIPPILEKMGVGWYQGRRFLRMDQMPVQEYMDSIGASQRLRETLWFNWGNFDGHPERTSIGAYAVPIEYMMDGLWTPRDGASAVAKAFKESLEQWGGEIRRNSPVSEIVLRNNSVCSVRVGEELIRCRKVVSGIGAKETYGLLESTNRPPHAERINSMPSTVSILTVYLSLIPEKLQAMDLNAVNYWVECEADGMYHYWEDFEELPPWFVLSLASKFQKQASPYSRNISAEIFVGVQSKSFKKWVGTRTQRRGSNYVELKSQLTQLVLSQAERTWSGFRDAVCYAEASTPLTIESYTGHQGGAAYGIAPRPGRYSERSLRCETGIGGLVLAGQDVSAAGVIGAFYGGLAAASTLLRRDAAQIILENRHFPFIERVTRGVIS